MEFKDINRKLFKPGSAFAGFTLTETLVAIFIFIVMMSVLAGLIVTLYRTQNYTLEQSLGIDEARRGVEIMVKEIRGAAVGDDGSYPIEKADDKEFIFYSDIDGDNKVERVRYFLGTVNSGSQTQECQTSLQGGTCGVNFSNFLQGTLTSAQIKTSLQGDFGASDEYADFSADGNNLGRVCQIDCTDCPGVWQGATTFDVTNQAIDGSIFFLGDANNTVDPLCPYAMKANFEFSWSENLQGLDHEFRKGVIEPVEDISGQVSYPLNQENIQVMTSFVRNLSPIFSYFDENGNQLVNYPARLIDTKLMKVYLIINVDPNHSPQNFELESYVQLRNLKTE